MMKSVFGEKFEINWKLGQLLIIRIGSFSVWQYMTDNVKERDGFFFFLLIKYGYSGKQIEKFLLLIRLEHQIVSFFFL